MAETVKSREIRPFGSANNLRPSRLPRQCGVLPDHFTRPRIAGGVEAPRGYSTLIKQALFSVKDPFNNVQVLGRGWHGWDTMTELVSITYAVEY